ncbi:MAG: hypothetical protein J6B81_04295 [Spirochaetaceae bacterium]|nr:hypothetical protein [Spirochaetaceae bacterium]
MSSHPDTFSSGNPWFTEEGLENDVVLSTRVRLARNLANFAFPSENRKDDGQRVQALVFDAFSKMENPDHYQCVPLEQLDFSAKQLLAERGILPECEPSKRNINLFTQDTIRKYPWDLGLAIRTDGRAACVVNCEDHLHIAAFSSGLDLIQTRNICLQIDSAMQEHLQFAASYDFGYLTSSLLNAGSGMKLSLHLFLSGLQHQQQIAEFSKKLQSQGCNLTPVFGTTTVANNALGACYQLSTKNAFVGSEEDQVVEFVTVANALCLAERNARSEFYKMHPTMIKHLLYRMVGIANYSRFLECSEAIEIISILNYALSQGFLEGITFADLHALCFRVRNTHLDYLRRSGSFMFEEDVEDFPTLVIPRLRALLVQEALESVKICI